MAEKIKITYILPSMARGGAERFLLDLLNNLDKNYFSPSIILFKSQGVAYQELAALKLPVFVLNKKNPIDLKNIWHIYKIIKEINPHIVHTQLGGDIRGRLAAKLAGVKIIISTEQNINQAEKWYQTWAKIISSLWTQAIVAISAAVAQDMRRRYLLPEKKCQLIIPNGINTNKFIYQENRPSTSIITVGAIGRLVPQKGFDQLIVAWQELAPTNARLLIAGEGPDREALQKQISKANLNQQIKLIGDVADTTAFYASLNLLIIPSRWEGLGLVALEAGASGVPVVASATGGLKEIINETNGWLLDTNHLQNWPQILKSALDDLSTEAVRLKQQRLHDLITKTFDIIKVSQAYSELYLKWWRQIYENPTSK